MSGTNPRLRDAESPYLREAADQPVDWYPWGEAAFQKAREEGKPVLVDSGAVWCHWCHVMDHESYEHPATADVINERFVPVKLDRDERPDVDRRLQQAVGAITGRGGWPLTAFLTPDGDVFYGGTYFPREPKRGMPAFQDVLDEVATLWDEDREAALGQADKIQRALEDRELAGPAEGGLGTVEAAVDDALGTYDAANGGFGNRPKFPHATTLDLLLALGHGRDEAPGEAAREAVAHTFTAMRKGGIWDHLDGGFHRYSVDEAWRVPHFEKMLYDNGLLLAPLARAARLDDARADVLEDAARGTTRFVRAVLERPEGGFGGSMDADRRPDEEGPLDPEDLDDGGYFTWTVDEVEALLDDETFRVAELYFGLDFDGDMSDEHGANVLRVDAEPEAIAKGLDLSLEAVHDRIDEALEALREARAERQPPFVDPTVYTDWNAMAAHGLLLVDALHGAPEAREGALAALDRLLDEAVDGGEVLHAVTEAGARVPDLVDDHAQLLPALLAAHHATREDRYLDHAEAVADRLVGDFQREDGRLRFRADDEEPAPQGDQPTPSPGAQAALHLPRVARATGREDLARAADDLLEVLAGRAEDLGGMHGGTLHRAMLAREREPPHVVVTGAGAEADALWDTARGAPEPLTTLVHASDPDDEGVPAAAREAAEAFDETVAVVCRGSSCQVARDADELATLVG